MSNQNLVKLCFTFPSSLSDVLSGTGDLDVADVVAYFANIRTAVDIYEQAVLDPSAGMSREEVLRALHRIPSHRVIAAAQMPGGLSHLLSVRDRQPSPGSDSSLSDTSDQTLAAATTTGGHGGILERAGGTVLQKRTNATEWNFYETIRNSGEKLENVIPKSFGRDGVLALESGVSDVGDPPLQDFETGGISSDIFIENIAANFEKPSLLDIKIGESTASRSELLRHLTAREAWLKKRRMKFADRASGSSSRGWRVVGGTEIRGHRVQIGKNSRSHLQEFIESNSDAGADIARGLRAVRTAVVESSYAFIASSVLIAVDLGAGSVERAAKVKLIDFAHAFAFEELGIDQHQKYRVQFLKGIDNLISNVEQIASSCRQECAEGPRAGRSSPDVAAADVSLGEAPEGRRKSPGESLRAIVSEPMQWDPLRQQYKLDASVLASEPHSLAELARATAEGMRNGFSGASSETRVDLLDGDVSGDAGSAKLSMTYLSYIAKILNEKVELGICDTVIKICP
ncbi:inositol polyphosphate kinase family protein [Streptomyces sp. NBC_01455]|uniref:inositol polyphosphate kinase family protein n=1 Tax=Streptomyces sp. NBC_01455 TaxID=2903874 RepID=UPI002E362BC5|nr:inositol polyphosphate kinase family protein [Streptomyces sp. NBC_01455]